MFTSNRIRNVSLARLVYNVGMSDGEVVELLKIANGHLPRVRYECESRLVSRPFP
jgi:hypothetical protein